MTSYQMTQKISGMHSCFDRKRKKFPTISLGDVRLTCWLDHLLLDPTLYNLKSYVTIYAFNSSQKSVMSGCTDLS